MRWVRKGRGGVLGALVLLVAVAVLAAIGTQRGPGRGRDETWARCQREGLLRVGMDASYPPFEVEVDGQFQGYDVDMAQEIGRRLGLEVTFANTNFDGLYDALASGRVDILISALPYDRKMPDVRYTGGYFNAGQVLVTRRDDERIKSHKDLGGYRVGVEMGSMAHQEARRLREQERISLTIETGQSSDEVLDLLQVGQVDVVVVDMVTARVALRDRPDLVIRGNPLTDESFVIAVRRDSPELYAAVNGILDVLRGEGWLDALADRWL